jgi:hypothetical protein
VEGLRQVIPNSWSMPLTPLYSGYTTGLHRRRSHVCTRRQAHSHKQDAVARRSKRGICAKLHMTASSSICIPPSVRTSAACCFWKHVTLERWAVIVNLDLSPLLPAPSPSGARTLWEADLRLCCAPHHHATQYDTRTLAVSEASY